jgi:hypothetical protein
MDRLEDRLENDRKNRHLFKEIGEIIGDAWKFVYNHPRISAFAATATAIGTDPEFYKPIEQGNIPYMLSNLILAGTTFLLTYLPLNEAKSIGGLKNVARLDAARFKRTLAEKEFREKVFKKSPGLIQNTGWLLSDTGFLAIDDSFPYYMFAFAEQVKRGRRYKPLLMDILQVAAFKFCFQISEAENYREEKEGFDTILALKKGDLEKIATSRLWKIIDEAEIPYQLDLQLAYANILEITGRKNKAEKLWELALGSNILLFEKDFRKFGESRNEVLVHDKEQQDSNTLYIRRYNLLRNFFVKRSLPGTSLKQESEMTRYFSAKLGTSVAEAVAIVNIDNRDYLVTKTAGDKTLSQFISDSTPRKKMKNLKEAARLLAQIHKTAKEGEESGEIALTDITKDNPNYYAQRIDEILFLYDDADMTITIEEKDRTVIRENYHVITHKLLQLPASYYKDHSPNNIVINDFEEMVALDFESRKKLPPQLDLVTLLEFGHDYIDEKEKKGIIKSYLKERNKKSCTKTDLDEFMLGYDYIAVQRHLELVGYKSRDVLGMIDSRESSDTLWKEFEKRNYHLRKACESIETLISKNNNLAEIEKLAKLRDALTNVKIDFPELKVDGQ